MTRETTIDNVVRIEQLVQRCTYDHQGFGHGQHAGLCTDCRAALRGVLNEAPATVTQQAVAPMTRLRLMRYVGPETDWQPGYALARRSGELLVDSFSETVLTFTNVKAAVDYAREHDATLEWEGSPAW